jgi:hypothetical protein
MKTNQIIGWLLLALGIAIIFYSIFSSFNIFTGKTAAPQIFKSEVQKTSLSQKGGSLESQFQEMIREQLKGFIPADTLPKILNLVVWSIFAWILIMAGGQIAGLGIKLLK